MVNACTIIARNYLAHARVLAASFLAHHPDGTFTLLLVDDEPRTFDESGELFRCLRLSDIGLAPTEITRLAALYDVTELATAVKPRLVSHLLSGGLTDVIYLDPDIKIYGSLEGAARLAREHGIVLTPHMLAPLPKDGQHVTDFHILAAGVYNLGFIALGARAAPFIAWWWEKTQREAYADPTRMMFTDQRWVDLAPSLFEHFILKDPSYNVAYWNLHERDLAWEGSGYTVNGVPLTFFHFSGFDGRNPHLLSKHQGDRPRILLSQRPAVARICREYRASLEGSGLARVSVLPYRWMTLPSGVPFDRRMRLLYREALEAFEAGKGPEPPNPFDPGEEERFMEWLREPVAPRLHPTISRYLHAIYEARPDVQHAFPGLAGKDADLFLDWVLEDGVVQHDIPLSLLPIAATDNDGRGFVYAAPSGLTNGVNIAGYLQAEVGVGEAGRLLTAAIEAAKIPHSTLTYDVTRSRKAHPFLERGDRSAPHDINVVCVNADQLRHFAREAGPGFFDGRYTVGYWFWELERFPATMHQAFDYVDEVWAATDFMARAYRAVGRRPVHTVPLPVPIPVCSPGVSRDSLRLPPGFMFLFAFDFFSILERKNPIGLINAFQQAFRPGEGPVLVIKTINGDARIGDLERVRAAAAARPDIFVIDEYYSAEEKNSLLALCDCYVSLHRSEGLGLIMGEAMGLGKPVIATGYSGNLHYMTAENSYLVDHVMTEVPAGCAPYPQGTPWADPDLAHAAALMRRVYEKRDEAARKAETARRDILTKHSVDAVGLILKRRLDDIRRTDRRSAAASVTSGAAVAGLVDAPRPETPALASLDRVAALLTPTPSVAPRRRFRRPLLMVQRLLFKVLRPYWWQQRQVQSALLGAVREAVRGSARAERSEGQQRQAVEALWTAVHSLERLRPEVEQAVESSARGVAAANEVARLQQAVTSFQESVDTGLKSLSDRLAALTPQESSERRLDSMTGQIEALTTSDALLRQRLYATPYMADPRRFLYADAQGRNILGFRTRRGSDGDVYAGFEDVFRGPEEMIRDRFRAYVPLLKRHDAVVDIGCGRGELLDLLRTEGVPAVGVERDEAMVYRCRARGHVVEQTDGLSYLRAQPAASLSAIVATQVVEHLPYDDLLSLLALSRSRLKAGGQLIFETVNPHALEAFKTFWTDLTHERPIFPEVAVVLCWLLDFDQAYVFFPNGVGDDARDRMTCGEYAVVATKRGAD